MSINFKDVFCRKASRDCHAGISTELRMLLAQDSHYDDDRALEIIEAYLWPGGIRTTHLYDAYILDPDILSLIGDLCRKNILKLRKDAAYEMECLEQRKATVDSTKNLESIKTRAECLTNKANEYYRILVSIEEEKRRVAQEKARKNHIRLKKLEKAKKYGIYIGIPLFLIIICLFYCLVIKPIIQNINIEKFHTLYEEELQAVLEEYHLDLLRVEYSDLIPDNYLDYWATERINEYEVKVYLNNDAQSYPTIYEILREVSYDTNDYLLSNTYEILPDYAYVDDDSKETGFHEIITIFIFEDNSAYRLRYSTTLVKDGEKVWEWKKKNSYSPSSSNIPYSAPAGKCMYSGCDGNRADGKYYCHKHKCNEPGCTNSTMPHLSYCENHNCIYPGCGAAKYRFVGSNYCQTHYVHQ